MIDNYSEAMALIEQMKEQLPIPVYAGHGLMRMMRDPEVRRGLALTMRVLHVVGAQAGGNGNGKANLAEVSSE